MPSLLNILSTLSLRILGIMYAKFTKHSKYPTTAYARYLQGSPRSSHSSVFLQNEDEGALVPLPAEVCFRLDLKQQQNLKNYTLSIQTLSIRNVGAQRPSTVPSILQNDGL